MPQGVEDLVACCNDKLEILAEIFGLKVYIHRRQRSYFHLLRIFVLLSRKSCFLVEYNVAQILFMVSLV